MWVGHDILPVGRTWQILESTAWVEEGAPASGGSLEVDKTSQKTVKSCRLTVHQCFSSHSLRGVELAYCKWQHKGAEMANTFRYINRLFLVVKG